MRTIVIIVGKSHGDDDGRMLHPERSGRRENECEHNCPSNELWCDFVSISKIRCILSLLARVSKTVENQLRDQTEKKIAEVRFEGALYRRGNLRVGQYIVDRCRVHVEKWIPR